MKKFLPFILICGFIYPIQSVQAFGCTEIKKMIKSYGADINFKDAKGAKKMVDAYELSFKNPKCMPTKDILEMKKYVKEVSVECAKSNNGLAMIFSKPVLTAFCGGFKNLLKYTKQ